MPPEGVKTLSHAQILRNEEFLHLIKIFTDLGIKKVRFTGGEPLVRKGFLNILTETKKKFPDLELCLTTNGTLIENYLNELVSLKIKKINISLDSFSSKTYQEITGFDYFSKVINNLEKLLATNFFEIKINSVLSQNTLEELPDFLNYFKNKKITLRFIEKMPFTKPDKSFEFLPTDLLIKKLEEQGKLIRNEKVDTQVAEMYDLIYKENFLIKIGIIPTMTHKFCSKCNRLRLTADGSLKSCLHSLEEYNLKDLLRKEVGDEKIKKIIYKAMASKGKEHQLDCLADDGGCFSLSNSRPMSKIGG